MDRRTFITTGTIFLLTGCGKGYYRQILTELYKEGKEKEAENIQRIVDSYVRLYTLTERELDGKPVYLEREGIGITYKDFILTLDHIVSQNVLTIRTPSGVIKQPIKKTEEKTYLEGEIELEEIVNDDKIDIAVFKAPKDYGLKKYPFDLADSDKLYVGQDILIIGNPQLEGINVREGIISTVKPPKHLQNIPEYKNMFGFSAEIRYGDSGTAVVDRGTFELLGLAKFRWEGLSFGVKINEFKPYLK